MEAMTIGDLAKAARVPPRTIRFYEKRGVLPAPGRSAAGYRLYGSEDLRRVSLVRRARSLGFSLTEVGNLIRLAQHERCDSFQGEAAHLMVQKLAEVDAAIQRLGETRSELRQSLESFNGGDCRQAVLECSCDCLCLGTQEPSPGKEGSAMAKRKTKKTAECCGCPLCGCGCNRG